MRYFFNLRRRGALIEDPEGQEFGDVAELREEAIVAARQIMSDKMLRGIPPDGSSQFEITDELRNPVLVVPFSDAYAADEEP